MCEATSQLRYKVALFSHSNFFNSEICQQKLKDNYGVDDSRTKLRVFQSKKSRGIEFFVALYALMRFMRDKMKN
jgi:hypothetical protein